MQGVARSRDPYTIQSLQSLTREVAREQTGRQPQQPPHDNKRQEGTEEALADYRTPGYAVPRVIFPQPSATE